MSLLDWSLVHNSVVGVSLVQVSIKYITVTAKPACSVTEGISILGVLH